LAAHSSPPPPHPGGATVYTCTSLAQIFILIIQITSDWLKGECRETNAYMCE
jgi:hypothetical protein